jgi:hypothetical protein
LENISLSGNVSHTIVVSDGTLLPSKKVVFDSGWVRSGRLRWRYWTWHLAGGWQLEAVRLSADYADAFVGELGYVVPVPLTLVGNGSSNVLVGGATNGTITEWGAADI